ncbi:MAG: hypothetical protein ACI90V_013546 [Bacillariaceae sp.]|jgi:hypothetical protein
MGGIFRKRVLIFSLEIVQSPALQGEAKMKLKWANF